MNATERAIIATFARAYGVPFSEAHAALDERARMTRDLLARRDRERAAADRLRQSW